MTQEAYEGWTGTVPFSTLHGRYMEAARLIEAREGERHVWRRILGIPISSFEVGFNMNSWFQDAGCLEDHRGRCGTTACLGGTAYIHHHPRARLRGLSKTDDALVMLLWSQRWFDQPLDGTLFTIGHIDWRDEYAAIGLRQEGDNCMSVSAESIGTEIVASVLRDMCVRRSREPLWDTVMDRLAARTIGEQQGAFL